MATINCSFHRIPYVVFDNPNLSPCAKLLFAYLLSRESYNVDNNRVHRGDFVQCYLRVLAKKIGKSVDSVRKNYIPELIDAGFIEKKTIGGKKGNSNSAICLFRILWENIVPPTQDKEP